MAEQTDVNPIDDVRNDVAEAIKSLRGEEPRVVASDAPPDDDNSGLEPEAPQTSDRPRDETGKFVAKDKTVEAPVEAAPESIPSTDAAKASEQVSTPAVAPPAGWTAAEKAEWSKLPPAVQAAVSRREQEMSRGGQQWSEEKRRYEQMIAPVAQEAQRLGMQPDQALKALMGAHHALQQNAPAAIAQLAQQYGVDLATLASNPPAPQAPRVEQLPTHFVEKVSSLESRLNDFLANQTVGIVDSFAKSPGHEHYAAVENDLVRLIPLVQQSEPHLPPMEVLQKAYDQAIWLNPDVRAKMLAEQHAKAEAERTQAIAAKAAKASKAAVSVKGSSNGAMPPPKVNGGGDVYDDVRAAITQLRG